MMQENNATKNLELFYDCFDESCSYLYEVTHQNYFELMFMTAKNILAGEVLNDLDQEHINNLNQIYEKMADVEFTTEDVRLAMQSQVLKALKEMRLPNGMVTPNNIGMVMCYLISRLAKNKKQLSIVDPLVGSGNLLYTIANHLTVDLKLYGADNNEWFIKIAKMIADLMGEPVELFLQDTLNLNLKDMDFVVYDMPNNKKDGDPTYPYKLIMHYLDMLKDNGYIIGLVNDDFFEHDKDSAFKKELIKQASIIGILEFPDNFFVSYRKFIVVIQKKVWEEKKCFMVKLPSFTDAKAFNSELVKLEMWFNNNLEEERE